MISEQQLKVLRFEVLDFIHYKFQHPKKNNKYEDPSNSSNHPSSDYVKIYSSYSALWVSDI